MTFGEIISGVIELGFPVFVAIFLLLKYGEQIEAARRQMINVVMGLRIVLAKLDALEEYDRAIKELEGAKDGYNDRK